MAAFYSVFSSNNNNEALKSTPGYWDEFFPDLDQIYAVHDQQKQGSSINTSANESSSCCLENIVTGKQRSCESFTSSMADKADSGEQVTQIMASLEYAKRKFCHGSPSNSANSKEMEEVKCKRQKGSKGVKNDKKGDEEAPKGYIHVRARRGQATDSHSLAERARREKISQKMKTLQALVPGCDKVNGKALMLDEIISYVQSLQNQVEFLSMKLACVDPMVYVFGLMDHDTMISGTEGIYNGVALPMQSTTQSNGSSLSVATSSLSFPLTSMTNNSAMAAALPDVAGGNDSTGFFQDEQKPIIPPLQGGRSSYWGLDDLQQQQQQQESNIISNQFGFGDSNNLYSFQ